MKRTGSLFDRIVDRENLRQTFYRASRGKRRQPDVEAFAANLEANLRHMACEVESGSFLRNGFLPVLIPESLLGKEKEHFAGFNPEVFWVTHSGENEIGDRLALRPTSETLAYSLYSKWIKSWRDLPLKLNFWNTALRAEIKENFQNYQYATEIHPR